MNKVKKLVIKVVSATMAIIMCFCVFACKSPDDEIPQSPNDIQLKFWDSGLGKVGIERVVKEFNNKQSKYKVWLDPFSATSTGAQFGQEDIDTNDIYMIGISAGTEKILLDYAEPLDEVLDYTPAGETGKIINKFPSSYLSAVKSKDNHYYKLSWGGGNYGIAYNTNIIDGVNYPIPKTTKELEEVAMMLYEARQLDSSAPAAFMNTEEKGDNWKYVLTTAHAQYDGLEYYNGTFLPLKADDGTLNSKDVLLKEDGRKKALEAYATIITPEYSYNGSLGFSYMDAQTMFINGKAAMMPNGTWLLNEMSSNKTNFSMMKVPVISSIIEKCTTIGDDMELRALITAIDGQDEIENVALTGAGYDVNETDRETIWDARKLIHANYDCHAAFIPKYSNAKEGAKEFLKYFYSDEGMTLYVSSSKNPQVFTLSDGRTFDMTGWTKWQKTAQEMVYGSDFLFEIHSSLSNIFISGGAKPFANQSIYITNAFANNNPKDRKNASDVWTTIRNYHNSVWSTYKSNAQL